MNQRLLTTDELLDQLKESLSDSYQTQLIHHKHKKIQYYIFWGIVAIAVLHLLLVSLPLMIGVKNTVNVIGQARVVGIPYVPGEVLEREGHTIVLNRYDVSNIAIDDHVVIYGILDTTYYWDVIITDFDVSQEIVSVSYDGLYSLDYSFNDIQGVYVRDANFMGIIMFVSSRITGLITTLVIYGSVITIYYVIVIKEIKVIEKRDHHEQEGTYPS